jgi:hypothetical protein
LKISNTNKIYVVAGSGTQVVTYLASWNAFIYTQQC